MQSPPNSKSDPSQTCEMKLLPMARTECKEDDWIIIHPSIYLCASLKKQSQNKNKKAKQETKIKKKVINEQLKYTS